MHLDEALKKVAVIGAAGKMGSGIAALLVQEIARLEASKKGNVGSGEYELHLIDSNFNALFGLRRYLKDQLRKFGEKHIIALREFFAKDQTLVSNEEIIQSFVEKAFDLIHFHTNLECTKGVHLIFEAIVEDLDAKASLFSSIDNPKAYFFTTSSSIPIGALDEKSRLKKRLIGMHFYNPPIVQRLVELIVQDHGNPEQTAMAEELAARMQKHVVYSQDVAGFIGNGHIIREALFATSQVRQLSREMPLIEAITLINGMTHDFLIRPMGIFQLIDYVGIDVFQRVAAIMQTFYDDPSMHDELILRMISTGLVGGQYSDGSQKNGFFQYENHSIKGIYSLEKKQYEPVPQLKSLKELPRGHHSWKELQKDPKREEKLEAYFNELLQMNTLVANLAQAYLVRSLEIANHLVKEGVAKSSEDVDHVLEYGFYHLYGSNLKSFKQLLLNR